MNAALRRGIALAIVSAAAACAQDGSGDWRVYSNSEYGIVASFPAGQPVCPALSGEHEHGFYQWLDEPCGTSNTVASHRSLFIWADYNGGEFSRQAAVDFYCPDTASRGVLKVNVPLGRGWAVSCREPGEDGLEHIAVSFIARGRAADPASGPDRIDVIYTARLGTDAAHREEDLKLFDGFLARLRLAGTGLQLGG